MHSPGQRTFRAFGDDMAQMDDFQAAILALWRDAQPRTLARVEVIEQAVAALPRGPLEAEVAEHARGEAHKLAGSMGTFGMPEGSEHARALEQRLRAGVGPDDADALAEHVRALRRIADAGPAGT
jgi:HPt (histidine-containing phosphotransfer) domain-containing protein